MAGETPITWRQKLRAGAPWIVGTLAALGIGGFLVAWSGLFNVAASSGHWSVTTAILEFGLESSVRTQSIGIDPPPLDDDGLARLGANHFATGCAPCHGAPGVERSPIVRNMLPEPPRLGGAIERWDLAELYWVVSHGLKFTGMPAWPAEERRDEVWALVAFLKQVPDMTPGEYRRLTGRPSADLATLSGSGDESPLSEAIAACGQCHEAEGLPPIDERVPALAGQHAAYLRAALHDYASGVRASGMMQPVAARLDDDLIAELSTYYAALPAIRGGDSSGSGSVERGRRIAEAGVPADRIPPCLSCHGDGKRDLFPRLEGQSATYIAGQLRLFAEGIRGGTPSAEIMQAVARRLDDEQIADVAAFFANAGETGASEAAEAGQ
ncbi:MAG: c-type cytochrome [Bauldia litoralis]